MKIEKLRNKKSYRWFLCGLIMVVVLTITLIKGSRAGYKSTATTELTSGVVKYSPYDFNIVSMYIDGVEQDKDTIIPDSGYAINEEQSYCYKESKNNKDSNARLFTDSLGNHVFKGISKGTKCIIYFDKTKTMEELLNNYYTDKRIRTSENKDFNVPYEETTTKTIFGAPDDDGTSYYFAGNPLDNWVEFGGYYWRIIRINGDGTIRMIYQGTEPKATGEGTQIGKSKFNELANNNAYVGYWYQIGVLRGLQSPSSAYTTLNNWFNNSTLKQSEYFNKIDLDAGFCGDRTPSTSNTEINKQGGTGTTTTNYGTYFRLIPGGINVTSTTSVVNPSYNCADSNDLYTYSEANKGNKILENPVGLITADEVAYAGMVTNWKDTNARVTTNYLYTNSSYWTISPTTFVNSYSGVDVVAYQGVIAGEDGKTSNSYGIRPVINLKKDVAFTGDGTVSNPFKVVI